MAVPQCHSPGCRMLKVLESSSGVGAGGLPLPLSAPPCPVPGLSRSHGAEPWCGFLPRARGAAPFPQLASARALLCLAVSSRHGSSSAWERWEAGWNRLEPAATRWNRLQPAATSTRLPGCVLHLVSLCAQCPGVVLVAAQSLRFFGLPVLLCPRQD